MPEEPTPKAALTPANQNPWYVLMTLYGEQPEEGADWDLAERNARAWNTWVNQIGSVLGEISETHSRDLDAATWGDIQAEVTTKHREEFERRNPTMDYPGFPQNANIVDLNGLRFERRLCLTGAAFVEAVYLSDSLLEKGFDFRDGVFLGGIYLDKIESRVGSGAGGAVFGGRVSCKASKFKGLSFDNSIFDSDFTLQDSEVSEVASFHRCQFRNRAVFSGSRLEAVHFADAVFADEVHFDATKFHGRADFNNMTCEGLAYFSRAEFKAPPGGAGKVSFVDAVFKRSTSFKDAIFRSQYPDFTGALLHDKTSFTDHPDNWPKVAEDPVKAKASCGVIRHSLGKQGLPEAEHFFYRREMGFAGQVGDWWGRLPYRLFGVLSDYGHSIGRPALWLAWLWFLPVFFFAAHHVTGHLWSDVGQLLRAAALSFANLFPLFGFQRMWFEGDFLINLPPALKFLGGVQTVASLPLLFFLGLALRTRFRMR